MLRHLCGIEQDLGQYSLQTLVLSGALPNGTTASKGTPIRLLRFRVACPLATRPLLLFSRN
jgi:hypothetical protein